MGHCNTKDGLKFDEEKMKAISNMQEPKNLKELRRCIGRTLYSELQRNHATTYTIIKERRYSYMVKHSR